ncbi:VWA domain-containing protein (plasmid) [Haloferax mediterranei ATCC 33500]|uniref:Magnesium chelatase n=1 Tax=Haloferax mediterranei (strain ATCC 33500 / DSM 1411 / JCM 8866 / NBRC 14739 / NCIMB 2177 / R-4) TaxID=523841 RepID=I3R9I2_HALMT|nr:VWA domain-containing protein [Haloferax mediterranei]AFK20892.1 protporphyrin IX magnesium chelatase / magnesium chelatase subunit ChlI [Haloferax mediterranei ATCC 33500]AHZ24239.1 magnesium chelatase [Haloferax mediterranei ATCC 33500]EMA05318.1 protporphyrin IX magnesium chelatase [Haloferax mediterranei ATCC 33500]MDX5989880.1 VWA domain-containing protein [Haloferax mediterranei ATCC 33500]QCQ77321.1 VWA domain-containing protein [Haloferax mediterranei ATCC 33500]
MTTQTLPFPAIVGQEELKRALLAVGVNDELDGLLVRGEKGTAKSTTVRALAELLPKQKVVAGCPYGCPPDDPARQCESCRGRDDFDVETRPVPLVTLPLGATRDRVAGTLSVADALDGEASFDPGLLARANRGILYVDEVNLLDDHLVDLLLDTAASGVNRVERDGVSVEHPAEFTLVGTMNPEEGDLRPQLRDRFALQASVVGSRSVDDRVTIIDRALERGHDSAESFDPYHDEVATLKRDVRDARDRLATVSLPSDFKVDIAELCLDAGVEGHRADIAIARTARTLAALDGRTKVITGDVREAAALALPHRLQNRPFDDAPDADDILDDHFDDEDQADGDTDEGDQQDDSTECEDSDAGNEETDADSEENTGSEGDEEGESDEEGDTDSGGDDDSDRDPKQQPDSESSSDSENATDSGGVETTRDGDSDDDHGDSPDSDSDSGSEPDDDDDEAPEATPLLPGQQRAAIGKTDEPPIDDTDLQSDTPGGGTRVAVGESRHGRGSRVRTEPATTSDDIDVAASVRTAASNGRTSVTEADLKTAVKRGSARSLIVFVVDASASMRSAMRETKGTVMSLLEDAYQQRDEVAFVAVAGDSAEVLLPPTNSVTLAARHLKELPTGDRTPLPDGLDAAHRLVTRAETDSCLVVVVTDGRANVADGSPTRETRSAARQLATSDASVVVVDAGDDGIGVTDILVSETNGQRISLSELSAERVVDAAKSAREK